MNLIHMKYAVEVAKTSSINKAAEKLYVGQSALSRAIKELEANLGVTLFERSAKGMTVTADGEVFLRYARKILKQVDEMESVLDGASSAKKRFSVCAPRADYIADAFAAFTGIIGRNTEAELTYKETGSLETISAVMREEVQIGIIRYAAHYDAYFKSMLDEKGLDYELITEFKPVLIMSADSPLAKLAAITREDLHAGFEIVYADSTVSAMAQPTIHRDSLMPDDIGERRVTLYERSGQFIMLHNNPDMFLYASPISPAQLERYNLVQRSFNEDAQIFKDVLIRRREHTLRQCDSRFIEELVRSKRIVFHSPID